MAEYGIQVELKKDYLVVKETLERIGIANRKDKIITPSCYIYFRNGKNYILHFKELLAMDGHKKDIDESDIERRNAIISMLVNWGLISIEDNSEVYQDTLKQQIFVLPYKVKNEFKINHKYQMKRLF